MSHVTYFEQNKLRGGESLIDWMEGWIGKMMGRGSDTQHNGALVLTNQRVAFVRKGFFGEIFEAMPIDKISSVETRSLMGYRVATFHTTNDELEFKTFAAADKFTSFVFRVENRDTPASTSSQTVGSVDTVVSQLERLIGLHSRGALSDDEFALAKVHLLARDAPQQTPLVGDHPVPTQTLLQPVEPMTPRTQQRPFGRRF